MSLALPARDRTHYELGLSAPLSPILSGHPLVLRTPLRRGRCSPLLPHVAVIHHRIILALSDHFDRMTVSNVDNWPNILSWGGEPNVVKSMGYTVQCVGMSGLFYMLGHLL